MYALVENNYPFELKVEKNGTLSSVGSKNYGGDLKFPCSAHPKVDRKTGDFVQFGY